jgi:hypothetical protein
MKTMKLGDQIKRVGEKEVKQMLERGWQYCSKKLWKENVRVIETKVEKVVEKKDNRNLKGKAAKK